MASLIDAAQQARLVDENEQLMASLESALEENALLTEERDRLRERLQLMAEEIRANQVMIGSQEQRALWLEPAYARQDVLGEELRVAFEELQVLTEELEVANTSLQQTNQELDARVELRTRQLKEIDAALQATETSLRAVADLVPDLLWRADAQGRADWFNLRWLTYTGSTAEALLDGRWLQMIHAEDVESAQETWNSAVVHGRPFEHECRIRCKTGQHRWFIIRAEPLLNESKRVVHWFAAGADIHDQREALEALQRSELRFRTLIEGLPQLVWRAVGTGSWTWSSPQWTAYTGQTPAEALDMGWLNAFHPDDRPRALAAWEAAGAVHVLEFEGRLFGGAEQSYRHFRTLASAVVDDRGNVVEWLGASTDVDEILRLQEEQGVLVAELQHRTRNLMSVVQAVTARTLHSVQTLPAFEERIRDRLSALARVQGLLSQRETGTRVPFDVLLRDELSAHIDIAPTPSDGKVTLDGPLGVPLRSATVQTFALALHELATNAVKYGALSDKGGRLAVSWRVNTGAAGATLCVDWRESGVAHVALADAPARGGGYGRELIERALPYQLGARTAYELTSDGVHCTIEVAVSDYPGPGRKADD